MKRSLLLCLRTGFLLSTAHQLPAPIQEVPESPTPVPEQSAKPKPKPKPKVMSEDSANRQPSSPTPKTQPIQQSRFAGVWSGVTHTFPWGDVSETITVDPTETTMTLANTMHKESRTARAERHGDTLTANFSMWGIYSLTPLSDGATALVRLQAPFNDNTASYHRTMATPAATKTSR
jgi:hypothetical protein